MNQRDVMKDWFKEMPAEHPSPDFTAKVMQRVMTEWTRNPVRYQPIISRKGWWSIVLSAMLLTSVLFILHAMFSTGTETATPNHSIYGIDLLKLLTPLLRIFEKLNNISPAVVIGALAIIALWFFDQLFVKTVKR